MALLSELVDVVVFVLLYTQHWLLWQMRCFHVCMLTWEWAVVWTWTLCCLLRYMKVSVRSMWKVKHVR